ncbi:MAG: PHP domain-containing protein [bacterium JZ-2024 1]
MFGYQTVSAVFHIHTIFSDGKATLLDLLRVAEATDVDVVAIVDHDTVENQNWMGWHRGKYILAGAEVTLRGEQHIVVFGTRKLPPPRAESASGVYRYWEREKVFTYIAHPVDFPCSLLQLGENSFSEWESAGLYDALEVWNLVSSAKKYAKTLFAGLRLVHNPEKYLPPPEKTLLYRWDELGKVRRFFGITGLDEHTWTYKKWFWKGELFGLQKCFSLLRLHIVLPESTFRVGQEKTGDVLLQALREGAFYSAFEYLGRGNNSFFFAECGREQFGMGQQVFFRNMVRLRFSLPETASVKVWRDHQLIAFFTAKEFTLETDTPGMYRPEVYRNGRLWILFNPIWLVPAG